MKQTIIDMLILSAFIGGFILVSSLYTGVL